MEEINKLQKKILNSVRKDDGDQGKLNDLNETNKKLAICIRNALKSEQEKVEKKLSPKKTLSPTRKKKSLTSREEQDLRLRQTQINSQSLRFFNIWNEYNQSQVQFREKSKHLLVKQCKITGNVDLSNEEIGELYENFFRKRALVKYQSQNAVIEVMMLCCTTILKKKIKL